MKQHIEAVHCLTTISIVHEGNKSFQCELCVFTTQKNCDLHKHKSEVHEGEKPHQCTEVRFSSFFSGGFITAIVVNPPERKLAKRMSV